MAKTKTMENTPTGCLYFLEAVFFISIRASKGAVLADQMKVCGWQGVVKSEPVIW